MSEISTYTVNSVSDELATVRNMLPNFTDGRKTEFLVYRAARFSITEALRVLSVTTPTFNDWLQDPVFYEWTNKHLFYLQSHIGAEVLKARFMRNAFLTMAIDSDLLSQRAMDPESMTKEDREDARDAAKRYDASKIVQMLKVLDPDLEKPREVGDVNLELHVNVELSERDSVVEKRAQAKKLLETFTSSARQTIIDNRTGDVYEIEQTQYEGS